MKLQSSPYLNNLQNLLQRISQVSTKYREIEKITGERFNVFSTLRLDAQENSHSLFLAELLNAEGSHAQGDLFLKEFLDVLNSRLPGKNTEEETSRFGSFKTSESQAITEYHIGFINGDEGGRIDILIRDKAGKEIIIENKIYAHLQDRQLHRYKNYAKDKGSPILFLTLFPNDFAEVVKEFSGEANLIKISYKEEILDWLERCLQLATGLPLIRETISQYINLLKQLTHQNTSNKMSHEIAALILQDRASYDSYCMLKNNSSTVTKEILKKLDGQLEEHIQKLNNQNKLRIKKVTDLSKLNGTIYEGFFFTNPTLEGHGLRMGFQFEASNFRYLCYGIARQKLPETEEEKKSLTAFEVNLGMKFDEAFPNAEQRLPWWPRQVTWSEYRDWDDETFANIQWGDLSDKILEIVSRFDKVLQETEALQNQSK
jgi:hypothetical protein